MHEPDCFPQCLSPLGLALAYCGAKRMVLEAGFEGEIEWQTERSLDTLTESTLLAEYAWVVLSAGMKEEIVRSRFGAMSTAFFDWKSAARIMRSAPIVRENALIAFRNERKVDAILGFCSLVAESGFERIRMSLQQDDVDFLAQFPYIGPVTQYHLAKNLGLDVAKPDRHLSRLTDGLMILDTSLLCTIVGRMTGERIAVVDLVLWRFCKLTGTNCVLELNRLAQCGSEKRQVSL